MRRILAIMALLLVPSSWLMAQEAEKMNKNAAPPPITKPSRDFVMINFGYTKWLTKDDTLSGNTVKTKSFAYTVNAFLCYDFPIKKTKLSFAAGLGISATNVFLDKQVYVNRDTSALLGTRGRFVDDTFGYKRYKFSTTYLQAPFELRYFSNSDNRNKGFKAAIGIQVGTLLGGHTKGIRGVGGTNIKEKVGTKRFLSPWNFAATARVGWGNYSVFGSYNLTNVFKDGVGPQLTPLTVGIAITGL